jgi:hypothetical protein
MNKKNCSLNKNPSEFVLRKALPVLGRVGWGLGVGGGYEMFLNIFS